MKVNVLFGFLILALFLSTSTAAHGQRMAGQTPGQNVEDMKFGPIPGLPACVTASVANGDPAKGPSIILGKITKGCLIPWHWHSANEHLMLVKGLARVEMKGGKPMRLREGGFALMPSHHSHQFRCETTCELYVYSDAAFDIHYVDARGNEIPVADALKASERNFTVRFPVEGGRFGNCNLEFQPWSETVPDGHVFRVYAALMNRVKGNTPEDSASAERFLLKLAWKTCCLERFPPLSLFCFSSKEDTSELSDLLGHPNPGPTTGGILLVEFAG